MRSSTPQGVIASLQPCVEISATSPPPPPSVLFNLAAAYSKLPRGAGAVQALQYMQEAVSLDPDNEAWRLALGAIKLQAGQPCDAASELEAAIVDAFSHTASVHDITTAAAAQHLELLLLAYRGCGRLDEAYRTFETLRVIREGGSGENVTGEMALLFVSVCHECKADSLSLPRST